MTVDAWESEAGVLGRYCTLPTGALAVWHVALNNIMLDQGEGSRWYGRLPPQLCGHGHAWCGHELVVVKLLVAVTILLIMFNLQFLRIGCPGSSFDYVSSGTSTQERNVCFVNIMTNFDAKLAVGMLFEWLFLIWTIMFSR